MRQMSVLGVEIKDYTLRESMRMVDSYLKEGKVRTIVYVTKRGLMAAENSDELRQFLSEVDLTISADSDILRAAGMENRNRIREIDNDEFTAEFLKRMIRQHRSIYLLTGTRAQLETLKEGLTSYEPTLHIVGSYSLDELQNDVDSLINEINMKMPDVLVSNISSPERESFYEANHMKLNARIWLMLKDEVIHPNQKRHLAGSFYQVIMNSVFKRKVSQYQNSEQEEKQTKKRE